MSENDNARQKAIIDLYDNRTGTVAELIDIPAITEFITCAALRGYNESPLYKEDKELDLKKVSSLAGMFFKSLGGYSGAPAPDFVELKKQYGDYIAKVEANYQRDAFTLEIYETEMEFYRRAIQGFVAKENARTSQIDYREKPRILEVADKIANIGMDKKRKLVKNTYRACAIMLLCAAKLSNKERSELKEKHKSLYSLVNDCDIRPINMKGGK